MIEVTFYRLVSVYDMRTWDWEREEYIPLQKGEGNICERCGREHAKVYVVENTSTGMRHEVGSTCSKKMFGWEPSQDELKSATKSMKTEQKRLAYEKYVKEVAQPLADSILALDVPAIRLIDTDTPDRSRYGCSYPSRYKFECGDVAITLYEKRVSFSDRVMFVNAWRTQRINETVIARYGTRNGKVACKLADALGVLIIVE